MTKFFPDENFPQLFSLDKVVLFKENTDAATRGAEAVTGGVL